MDAKRKIIGMLWLLACLVSGPLQAQDERTWTATSGHEMEGTLVSYTTQAVTLEDAAGKKKVIPFHKLSKTDQKYLVDFPDLRRTVPTPKGKLPWVDLRAKTAARSKKAVSSITTSTLAAEITVSNRSKQDLDIHVLWVFYGEPVNSRTRITKANDLVVIEPKSTIISLKALDELTFKTQDVSANAYNYGTRLEVGMKIHGYLVQAYSGGQLLKSYTPLHLLKDLAEDGGLLAKYRTD